MEKRSEICDFFRLHAVCQIAAVAFMPALLPDVAERRGFQLFLHYHKSGHIAGFLHFTHCLMRHEQRIEERFLHIAHARHPCGDPVCSAKYSATAMQRLPCSTQKPRTFSSGEESVRLSLTIGCEKNVGLKSSPIPRFFANSAHFSKCFGSIALRSDIYCQAVFHAITSCFHTSFSETSFGYSRSSSGPCSGSHTCAKNGSTFARLP